MQQTASEYKEWLKEELTKAYKTARLGKSKKPEVMDFDKIAAAVSGCDNRSISTALGV